MVKDDHPASGQLVVETTCPGRYAPDWGGEAHAFDADKALLLAHCSFESYNNPMGDEVSVRAPECINFRACSAGTCA